MVEVTNKLIFGQDLSVSLSYENFKSKFEEFLYIGELINKSKFEVSDKDNSLAFMLSPSGVRYMLEKNNV